MTLTLERLAHLLGDRYRIDREIGRGGMAIVYLAQDVRHQRNVAVKVLHPELAAALGADRFLAEIRVTANLQHPHILPLLDSGLLGDSTAVPYYVMPYVEGESLRERLERERQLSIGLALNIAKGVAAALSYAHKQGVIHRDIKPENILLQDDQPVVTDFGIALAVTAAGGQRLTQTGLSLGTPHYMSPEQAMGERHLDARVDIYALGVVTYEMLAGEPPFTGPNAAAVVAKVLTEKPPPLHVLRETVPAHVEATLHQALQKLPADRFASAADFAHALTSESLPPQRVPEATRRSSLQIRLRRVAPWIIAAAALGAAAWALQRPAPQADREQWDLVLPDSAPLVSDDERHAYMAPAISPDGKLLAYTAARESTTMLYLVRLGTGEINALPGTRGGTTPFFAPDGRHVGFLAGNQIRSLDLATGRVAVVHEGIDAYLAAWTASNRIVFLDAAGYGWIDADGSGMPLRLSIQSKTVVARPWPGPTPIPGTDRVLMSDFDLRVAVVTLADGSVRYLTAGEPTATPPPLDQALIGVWARFVAPNYLVVWRPGAKLLAVRFDPKTLRVFGKPVEVTRGVRVNASGVSPSGTWTYSPAFAGGGSTLAQLGDSGVLRRYPLRSRRYQSISLSPDARRIAVRIMSESGRDIVEVYDLTRDAARVGRIDADVVWAPHWDHTGRYIYTANGLGVVYRQDTRSHALDSIAVPIERDEIFQFDGVLGSDTIVATIGRAGERDIFAMAWDEPRRKLPLVKRGGDQFQMSVSPSGRWFAYSAAENAARPIIIESRQTGGQQLRLTATAFHIWDADDQLYFLADGAVNRVLITAGPNGPTAGPAERVANAAWLGGEEGQVFVPVAGGRQLIALVATYPPTTNRLVVVRHWDRELARLTQ